MPKNRLDDPPVAASEEAREARAGTAPNVDRSGRSGNRTVLREADVGLAVRRMAIEIVEKNPRVRELALVGLRTRGVPLARRLGREITAIGEGTVPIGTLDLGDQRGGGVARGVGVVASVDLPFELSSHRVILVDDVLHTGRTAQLAIDAILTHGRPRTIELAVLIEREGRQLPIHADYVGSRPRTELPEFVAVLLQEVDLGDDRVVVWQPAQTAHGADRPILSEEATTLATSISPWQFPLFPSAAPNPMTELERRVLAELAVGRNHKGVAARVERSEGRIGEIIRALRAHAAASNDIQLLIRLGLLRPTPGLSSSFEIGPLTRRERQVAIRLAQGETKESIAEALAIATHTVRKHQTEIVSKLGARGLVDALVSVGLLQKVG